MMLNTTLQVDFRWGSTDVSPVELPITSRGRINLRGLRPIAKGSSSSMRCGRTSLTQRSGVVMELERMKICKLLDVYLEISSGMKEITYNTRETQL